MSFQSDPAAVIRFEPDGYDIAKPWLMGRQMAGHGFLRAAVQGRGPGPVLGYTPFKGSASAFVAAVRSIDPEAKTGWVTPGGLSQAAETAPVLYLPDANLTIFAKLRLRHGPGRYSLSGVTHTLSTAGAQQLIGDLLSQPVMPWDALVCTSTAARATVGEVLQAQGEYLRWRYGPEARLTEPQLPVIPLGVHCEDFAASGADRAAARRTLGLEDGEVAAIYVGRLTFTGKAHPFQMFEGLQAAAERTGARPILILCGRAPNDEILAAFTSGAAKFAPDVRLIVVDGREDAAVRGAWAGADIFISLSDGIQETFGLTPLEAMAAGLPVVVSDWNGYRDTVRDGVDGFRIPTWAPAAGPVGAEMATLRETGSLDYEAYSWAAASMTSVDAAALADRLTALVASADLRRTMGAAGRRRAMDEFAWANVFRRYQALWSDLDERRRAALETPAQADWLQRAPTAAPDALDPFHAFRHHPTARIEAQTVVVLATRDPVDAYDTRSAHVLFSNTKAPPAAVMPLLAELAKGPATVQALAAAVGVGPSATATHVATLAKMGVVTLRG